MNRTAEEERIFRALGQIETPEYDIEGAVKRRLGAGRPVRRRRVPRAALLAACLALALTLGAAALGMSGNWGRFFGGVPENAVTTVGVSQTAGEYTLTLEDAMVDHNGAILLLALSRADGGKIDPEAALRTNSMNIRLLADGVEVGGTSNLLENNFSGDGKINYFCLEVRDENMVGSLAGKTLTLTADGVAIPGPELPQSRGDRVALSTLNLSEIPEVSLDQVTEDPESLQELVDGQNLSLALPLSELFPQYSLRGLMNTEQGLTLAVSNGTYRRGDLVCVGATVGKIKNHRTGDSVSVLMTGPAYPSGGGMLDMEIFHMENVQPGDLPYLELFIYYRIDRVLSDQPFRLDFTATNGASLVLQPDMTVELDGVPVHLTELRVSAVGLVVRCDGGPTYVWRHAAPTFDLRDGSRVALAPSSGSGNEGRVTMNFEGMDENGDRIFFDVSQIKSVTFGDKTISVS